MIFVNYPPAGAQVFALQDPRPVRRALEAPDVWACPVLGALACPVGPAVVTNSQIVFQCGLRVSCCICARLCA